MNSISEYDISLYRMASIVIIVFAASMIGFCSALGFIQMVIVFTLIAFVGIAFLRMSEYESNKLIDRLQKKIKFQQIKEFKKY